MGSEPRRSSVPCPSTVPAGIADRVGAVFEKLISDGPGALSGELIRERLGGLFEEFVRLSAGCPADDAVEELRGFAAGVLGGPLSCGDDGRWSTFLGLFVCFVCSGVGVAVGESTTGFSEVTALPVAPLCAGGSAWLEITCVPCVGVRLGELSPRQISTPPARMMTQPQARAAAIASLRPLNQDDFRAEAIFVSFGGSKCRSTMA